VFLTSPQTKGRLLLATPPLTDPNFDRTVVYMLEHHEDGAIGLVLNRPTDETLIEPLDRWTDLQSAPSTIFAGGPVDTNAMIAMATTKKLMSGTTDLLTPISGLVASTDLSADPAIVAAHVEAVRIFRGYAGWGAGQLELEIEEGAWLVLDAEIGDVFSDRPDELWHDVLRRQPGRLRWLALAPDDLSSN
jgi:putative transcriptional regulator